MTFASPSPSSKRRLLIRPGGIGDCILCFPAMEHLRCAYTEVWTTSAVRPLIQFADTVRPIAFTGLDLLGVGDVKVADNLRDRIQSFDDIVSWYGAARPEFRHALTDLNPNCTFLRALPPDDFAGHAADFFAAQVRAPLGSSPALRLPPVERRETIVIHPFSGNPRKNWPLDYFRALEAALPLPVEWMAGPEEELPQAQRFENLFELSKWIRGARLYIGNDSGITHLAAASGTPVLALFGPTRAATWAPRNAMVMQSESLSSLHPSTVLEKALQVLA